jgi:cell wall-associated NlpC family hydrolase
MAKSAAIPLGLAGIGSVLLISGIQGESIAQVIRGEFGKPPKPGFGGNKGKESEEQIHTESAEATPIGTTNQASRAKILTYAQSQFGVPYVWGGELEKKGFDCSGLTQWVYAKAGIHIPRTAQEQYNYMRHTKSPQPGDLVFFGSGPSDVSHVGIVVSPGLMIDAEHPGTVIKTTPFSPKIGSSWGSDKLIGYGQA